MTDLNNRRQAERDAEAAKADQQITYSNPRREAVIADWPWGSKQRTTATFTIEGDYRRERAVRVTIDPRTGKPTAPKKLTYAMKARIVDGSDGRTYIAELSMYGFVSIMRGDMKYNAESIHPADPRYAAVMALFEDGFEDRAAFGAFVSRMMKTTAAIALALFAFAGTAGAAEWDGNAFRSQFIERMQSCGSVSPYDRMGLAFCDAIDRTRGAGVNILLMSDEALCYTFEGVAPGGCAEQIDNDKRARRAAAGPGPTERDLCPAPRKLGRDGCQ